MSQAERSINLHHNEQDLPVFYVQDELYITSKQNFFNLNLNQAKFENAAIRTNLNTFRKIYRAIRVTPNLIIFYDTWKSLRICKMKVSKIQSKIYFNLWLQHPHISCLRGTSENCMDSFLTCTLTLKTPSPANGRESKTPSDSQFPPHTLPADVGNRCRVTDASREKSCDRFLLSVF